MNPVSYSNPYVTAADAEATERAAFIRNTYIHLAMALGLFVGIEAFLFSTGLAANIAGALLSVPWLVVLGAFMLVSWIADRWAQSDTSKAMQYLGLGAFVLAQAIIFVPLLVMAAMSSGVDVIWKAGITTGFLFGGLTLTALLTRADFSFLRGILVIGSFVALGIIVVGMIGGFSLGTWFSGAMVLIASISVLYTTSNMVHHYRTDQYVAASLGLFASIALMLWYLIQIFMSRD